MKRLSILCLISFLLIGCTPSKVIITPDTLPEAIVGKLYYAEIEISGGSGPVSSIKSNVTPDVLVIQRNPKKGRNDNQFIIYGKPITTETITVKMKGDMISTGWRASAEFEKTYVIKVKEKE